MTPVIELGADGTVLFNREPVQLGGVKQSLVSTLGPWERIFEGDPPAPLGYRNNHWYFYDSMGIALLDQWTDETIQQLSIHYARDPSGQPEPGQMYSGDLMILGHSILPEIAWDVLHAVLSPPFKQFLGGAYSATIGTTHACFEFFTAPRTKSPKPTLASISFSLTRPAEGRLGPQSRLGGD